MIRSTLKLYQTVRVLLYKGLSRVRLALIALFIQMGGEGIMAWKILVIKNIFTRRGIPRVHHSENEFTRGNAHINCIESFWGYAKIRLIKFKGMNKNMFNLHLKECEFRFNNRKQNV